MWSSCTASFPTADAQGVRQLAHYVVGIATEDLGRLTFTVGAIGFGVGDRMQRGYKFLCENYEDGDEIYVIGFSRGAFQARSLAGLVALAGIARSVAPETVAAVWDCYEQNKLSPDAKRLEELRAGASYPVRIKCVGVWDTVGNLGIPFVRKGLIKELLGFHDTELSPLVDVGPACARHRRAARAIRAHTVDPQRGVRRYPRARSSSRSGSRARTPTSAAASRTAGCRTSRSCGWRNA